VPRERHRTLILPHETSAAPRQAPARLIDLNAHARLASAGSNLLTLQARRPLPLWVSSAPGGVSGRPGRSGSEAL